MQTNLYFLVRFFVILLFADNIQPADNLADAVKPDADIPGFEEIGKRIKEEQQAEIYRIEKKAVIFFLINKEERREFARELGERYRWETDMLFNGFIKQTNEFSKLIGKHNIKSELSYSSKFQIVLDDSTSVFFDREKEDQIMGEIFTDGKKKPVIEYGMFPNKELANLIEEFFGIENLGYIQPDSTKNQRESSATDSIEGL